MLRGINHQVIFEDEEDKEIFLKTIKKYKAISGYELFAYCLMGNHIHILIRVEKGDIGSAIKRIAGSYVYWYNLKYKRKGHLFQERFKSEAVEDDSYFFTVVRYIHRNPVEAGLCKEVEEFLYSSYNEYIKGNSEIVDTDFALSIMGKEEFINFNREKNDDKCMDYEEKSNRLNDSDAKGIIKKITKCSTAAEFQELESQQRDRYISMLKKNGLSIRQISRLTGVSFGIVRKQN